MPTDPTPGPRDHLVTERIARNLEAVPEDRIEERSLDPAEGPERTSRHAREEIVAPTYDPETNGEALERALAEHDRRSLGETSTISFANLDVRPYPHQERMHGHL